MTAPASVSATSAGARKTSNCCHNFTVIYCHDFFATVRLRASGRFSVTRNNSGECFGTTVSETVSASSKALQFEPRPELLAHYGLITRGFSSSQPAPRPRLRSPNTKCFAVRTASTTGRRPRAPRRALSKPRTSKLPSIFSTERMNCIGNLASSSPSAGHTSAHTIRNPPHTPGSMS